MSQKYVWLSAVAIGLATPALGMVQQAQVGLKYGVVVARYGVDVPMADGAILSATVVRPPTRPGTRRSSSRHLMGATA